MDEEVGDAARAAGRRAARRGCRARASCCGRLGATRGGAGGDRRRRAQRPRRARARCWRRVPSSASSSSGVAGGSERELGRARWWSRSGSSTRPAAASRTPTARWSTLPRGTRGARRGVAVTARRGSPTRPTRSDACWRWHRRAGDAATRRPCPRSSTSNRRHSRRVARARRHALDGAARRERHRRPIAVPRCSIAAATTAARCAAAASRAGC